MDHDEKARQAVREDAQLAADRAAVKLYDLAYDVRHGRIGLVSALLKAYMMGADDTREGFEACERIALESITKPERN
jgi:hypothetical protein